MPKIRDSVPKPRDPGVQHFHRPIERPFTADQRGRTTILFGGLTAGHDRLIEAVFQSCGYRCRRLPTPTLASFHRGRQYCNVGQCNPTYFTIGSLLETLHEMELQGLSREAIIDGFVFFTAGSCGPCRFGMYESEFRLALQNAGFDGFRVLLFQQEHGIKAASGTPGLQFTLNFGLGALSALNMADAIQDLAYRIRPYEVTPGETDRAVEQCLGLLADWLRGCRPEPFRAITPSWSRLAGRFKWLRDTINVVGKVHFHLYSDAHRDVLARCRACLERVEVDLTRVKPIVKITGEFWAQTTEGDGNYRMFAFLQQEGAEIRVEPVAAWVMYLLYQTRSQAEARKGLEASAAQFWKRWLLITVAEALYAREFHRTAQALGGVTDRLVSQRELARLAHPFYHSLSRGGEGHLEVGKNVYYTVNRRCHMVLSLKPFGCMPSSQSDGVQSTVVTRFPGMIFLPIETSGEGEVNAHSRAQMALSDAKARARAEFDAALASTGRRLEDIRAYVAKRPDLRRALCRVPEQPGVAGVAATFVQHVARLMDGAGR